MRIFPKNLATFERKKKVRIYREEIFLNLIPMLTIEARVLNPSTCEVQGRLGADPAGDVGSEAPNQFFLTEW